MELPDIPALARRLGGRKARSDASAYPRMPGRTLAPDALRALGEEYLERTRIQRKTDRPYFIDKMPNNWAHVGLIRLILPNAKIVDARRHPLACCFSNFKQHFARGQGFSYDLAELGRYYRDYVTLMAHFDAALPGRVHRVIHEGWSRIRKPRSAACSIFSACPSTPPACASTRMSARCAPRARSRCAARSTARASTSGAPTSPGSAR